MQTFDLISIVEQKFDTALFDQTQRAPLKALIAEQTDCYAMSGELARRLLPQIVDVIENGYDSSFQIDANGITPEESNLFGSIEKLKDAMVKAGELYLQIDDALVQFTNSDYSCLENYPPIHDCARVLALACKIVIDFRTPIIIPGNRDDIRVSEVSTDDELTNDLLENIGEDSLKLLTRSIEQYLFHCPKN